MGSVDDMQYLVKTEPWRGGQGRPSGMLSSLWANDSMTLCTATAQSLEWEAKSGWWWCLLCGHCSNMTNTTHYIVESPKKYHQLSLEQFYQRRGTQGFPRHDAHEQALHIAAIAIRVAASKRPEEFAKLVQDIVALAD